MGPTGPTGAPATALFFSTDGQGNLDPGASGVSSVAVSNSNEFDVTFGQNMSQCACVATLKGSTGPGFVRASAGYPTTSQVAFFTNQADTAQTNVLLPFYAACYCH
jgi:hypothetical protein